MKDSPRPPRAARWFAAVAASLSLVLGIVALAGAKQWYDLRTKGIVPDVHAATPSSTSASDPPLPTGSCSERPCNYLILGSDSRTGLSPEEQGQFGTTQDIGGESRADTIMLVHTDPSATKATIVSFPRDLWVDIPDHGMNKINSAFEGGLEHGGPQLMLQTVANLTGLRIDHFVYVDLAGFQKVVDLLHGVDLCVPAYDVNTPGWLTQSSATGETTSTYYSKPGHVVDLNTGLDVLPGCQTMNGQMALAYVRTRHLICDTIPDFYRIRRQQQFLSALINQMLQPGQLVRALSLIQPVVSTLHRDEGLLPGDLVYLVGNLRGITSGAADFRSVPGATATIDGLSVVRMDPSAEEIFQAIRDGKPIGGVGEAPTYVPPSEANVKVAIVDDGGPIDEVFTVVSQAGFDVAPGVVHPSEAGGHPTDTDLRASGAVIAYAPGHDVEAGVLASYFPELPVVEVRGLTAAPVALWVTDRYRPPAPGGSPSPASGPGTEPCPSST